MHTFGLRICFKLPLNFGTVNGLVLYLGYLNWLQLEWLCEDLAMKVDQPDAGTLAAALELAPVLLHKLRGFP